MGRGVDEVHEAEHAARERRATETEERERLRTEEEKRRITEERLRLEAEVRYWQHAHDEVRDLFFDTQRPANASGISTSRSVGVSTVEEDRGVGCVLSPHTPFSVPVVVYSGQAIRP